MEISDKHTRPSEEIDDREAKLQASAKFVNASGAAALMGVSRQRVAQLMEMNSQRIPEPDGMLNNTQPIWLAETIIQHASRRLAE